MGAVKYKGNTYKRVVCNFSCGAASSVATKMAIETFGIENIKIVYQVTNSEHEDNARFIEDCEKWFGLPIEKQYSEKYEDIWDVFEKTKYLKGVAGARCTSELKRKVAESNLDWFNDLEVFGYTVEEKHRVKRFIENNEERMIAALLVDHKIDKDMCYQRLADAGIELPAMYKLGYNNNNCIGCVKGGMGYWNKIRKDFPDTFKRMAETERKIDISLIRERKNGETTRVFLDELEPDRGRYDSEPPMVCGIMCDAGDKEQEFEDMTPTGGNLIIDFETRSRCDLLARGTSNYALDVSTEILCMAAVYEDPDRDEEWLWYPHDGEIPVDLANAMYHAPLVMAHNAAFDRDIHQIAVEDHDFPNVAFDKWYCTSAQARVNAMPASLDKLTQALDAKHKKNHRGNQLIKLLSLPDKKTGEFNEDPKLLKEMGEYCLDDVRATKAAVNMLRPMTEIEHKDWLINERINERGIKVDLELAHGAMKYAGREQAEIGAELNRMTNGHITKHTQHARIAKWTRDNVSPDVEALMVVMKEGIKKYSLDKNIRGEILEKADNGFIEISDRVKQVIHMVQLGSKSSVSKFGRMITRADDEDERARGAFVYAGASQTLRYASRGLQLHNMARDCFNADQTEDLKEQMREGYVLEDDNGDLPVMQTLSKLLRPALIPSQGKVFVVGDWSSIEARALPWLSYNPYAEERLELFKQDVDIYKHTAIELGLGERQIGKVSELSLGYGGGAGAFNAMAKIYGLQLEDSKVTSIIAAWRNKNVWATQFWAELERAATLAIRNPGQEQTAGRVKYLFIKDLIEGTLLCILPGDLVIQYPKARLESVETKWGTRLNITAMKANWHPKQGDKEWPRVALWPGLLAENVTQAMCARLLRHALARLNLMDAPVVGHVHDEVILEIDADKAEVARDKLQDIMEHTPVWAEGIPLKAEPVIMTRYGK